MTGQTWETVVVVVTVVTMPSISTLHWPPVASRVLHSRGTLSENFCEVTNFHMTYLIHRDLQVDRARIIIDQIVIFIDEKYPS